MKAAKNWTSLAVLCGGGAVAFVACGEDPCAVELSCIERPATIVADSGSAGADGGDGDSGSNMASAGTGSGNNGSGDGSAGMAGTQMDSGMGPQVDGGNDGGQEQAPPVCGVNPTAGCVANIQDAVFVSAGVSESGNGSQQAPVKTIAEGVQLARDQDRGRILVCNGVYQERISLTVDDSGRSLGGGYNCDSWLYNPDGETLVRPTERGYALSVAGATQRVTISNFTFDALAGMDPGESSIAAFIVDSSDVRLKQVRLIAHDGVDAENGATAAYTAGNEWPVDNDLDGKAGKGYQASDGTLAHKGGDATEITCQASGETTTGGRGGDHPTFATLGSVVGQPGLPLGKGGNGGYSSTPQSIASGCDVIGGSPDYKCTCTQVNGIHGSAGDAGDEGAGASEVGQINEQGWLPSGGTAGGVGHPGGGGGGGDGAWQNSSASSYYSGWFGGGGGGAGGCGGAAGQPGLGGGASIALLILDASVSLEGSELFVANAGDGGAGSVGQAGQLPGSGGTAMAVDSGDYNSAPCAGGNGGQGGRGGHGGGGAGGISVGVAWAGDFEPTVEESAITFGVAGVAGIGADPGNNDGIAGVAQEVLEVPAG